MLEVPGRKLVVMGCDPMVLPLLDFLKKSPSSVNLVGVFAQPDRKHGRGQQLQPSEVKRWGLDNQVPVLQPESQPGGTEIAWLHKNQVELIIVFAYGHLLSQAFIEAVPLGILNVHTSLLPAYRGPAPIETAIALGEKQTGLSLMRLVKAMDAGPILKQIPLMIGPEDTGGIMRQRMATQAVALVGAALNSIFEKTALFEEQDHAAATYTRILSKADSCLDLRASAKVLADRIQGLYPWPGCTVETEFGTVLKIGSAQAVADSSSKEAIARVVQADATGIYITTGDGLLRLNTLQRPSGRMLSAKAFLPGFELKPGDCFKVEAMTQLLRE